MEAPFGEFFINKAAQSVIWFDDSSRLAYAVRDDRFITLAGVSTSPGLPCLDRS